MSIGCVAICEVMMNNLRFSWLEAGFCFHPHKITFNTASLNKRKYSSFFGVFRHPSFGVILYDTGYTDDFHHATTKVPEKLYALATPVVCEGEANCLFQLKNKDIHPDEVKIVIISHFHADHVCGLKHFKNAKFYFEESSLKYLQNLSRWRQVSKGFLNQLIPEDIFSRMVNFSSLKRVSLPTSLKPYEFGYDLLSDYSLLAIPLPGHMRGHMGLYFKYEGREIFIVADAVWHTESIRSTVLPSKLAKIPMDNWKTYARELNKLNELYHLNKEIVFLPSHCEEGRGLFK